MQSVQLTKEEQIALPRPVQEALGAAPGNWVMLEVMEDGTVIVHARSKQKVNLMSLRGILKPKVRGVTVEEMNETIGQMGAKSG